MSVLMELGGWVIVLDERMGDRVAKCLDQEEGGR